MNHPLEPVLQRHLAPLAAPDELWDRLRDPRISPAMPQPKPVLPVLTAIAATLLLVAAILPFVSRHATDSPTLRSSNAGEIRAWAKSRTGLDIPLPGHTSDMVRLTGACAVSGRIPSVKVDYRVGGQSATLVVSRSDAPAGDPNHRFLKCESNSGTRVSSWTMRGQRYTLAYAGRADGRDECLLCHGYAPPLVVSN